MLVYQNENVMKTFDVRTKIRDDFVILPHIHEFSEMLYVHQGTMTMMLDGSKLTVPEGHAALVFPHRIHEYTDETHNRARCIVYSNDFLQAFFHQYTGKLPRNPVVDLRHMRAIPDMLDGLNNGDIRPGTVKPEDVVCVAGVLNMIYYELLRQTDMIDAPRQDTPLYLAALAYISEHFRTDFTLEDMAHALGYHVKYLSHALHTLTGTHFRMFLASYRITHAKGLLREQSGDIKPISDIAHESGFTSLNTFNRTFHRFTGMTPSEYRGYAIETANKGEGEK